LSPHGQPGYLLRATEARTAGNAAPGLPGPRASPASGRLQRSHRAQAHGAGALEACCERPLQGRAQGPSRTGILRGFLRCRCGAFVLFPCFEGLRARLSAHRGQNWGGSGPRFSAGGQGGREERRRSGRERRSGQDGGHPAGRGGLPCVFLVAAAVSAGQQGRPCGPGDDRALPWTGRESRWRRADPFPGYRVAALSASRWPSLLTSRAPRAPSWPGQRR
jgi:hypothetical protein